MLHQNPFTAGTGEWRRSLDSLIRWWGSTLYTSATRQRWTRLALTPASRVQGQSPLWSWSTLGFWTLNGSRKFAHFSTIWKRKEMRYLCYLRKQVIWAKLIKRATASAVPFCKLSWSISSHFVAVQLLKSALEPKIAKSTKTFYFGGSRSSISIPLKSSSLVILVIRSISRPICNCFHAWHANISNITTF